MRNPSCREIRDQLIEAARAGALTPPLAAHIARCEECARFHAGQSRLSGVFAVVREELKPAPPRIEAALLAELNRRRGPVRRPGYRIAAVGGAIAAVLVAGLILRPRSEPIAATPRVLTAVVAPPPVVVAPTPTPIRPKRRAPARQVNTADAAADIDSSPFIELPWTVPLSPGESASVVRMNLAVSALIAAGLSVDADPASAAAADVVVGMDGRARAVRLVLFPIQ